LLGTRIEQTGARTPLETLAPSNKGGDITVKENPSRAQLDDSFYFELPFSWRHGTIELEFKGDNTEVLCKEGASTPDDCKTTVSFEKVPPLKVRLIGISWRDITGTVYPAPTKDDLKMVAVEIEQMYPIPSIEWDSPYALQVPIYIGTPDVLTLMYMVSVQKGWDGLWCTTDCDRIYVGVIKASGVPLLNVMGLGFPNGSAVGFMAPSGLYWGLIPHEIGHVLGLAHVPLCGAHGLPWDKYSPYSEGHISQVDEGDNSMYGFVANAGLYGVAELSHLILGPSTTYDLMTYCSPTWPSDWTYQTLRDTIVTRYGSSSFKKLIPELMQLSEARQTVLLITGAVMPDQNSGVINSVYALDSIPGPPPSGSYSIRLEDGFGNFLATYNFDPEFQYAADQLIGIFSLNVPSVANTTKIVLIKDGKILDSRSASPNAPTLRVIYPNGGEFLNGSTATIGWSANDPDGDPLRYVIQYSFNGGDSWLTLASGLDSTEYELDLTRVPGTSKGLIRIIASDGFHTAMGQSEGTFSVGFQPPEVIIQSPKDGRTYVGEQTIILEGTGNDNQDAQLGDSALKWSSNRNGDLGYGRSLSIKASTLTEGDHTITLTATNSHSYSAYATIKIRIEASIVVEPITLVSPLDSASFDSCSLYQPPTFTWVTDGNYKSYEIQFSPDDTFASITVKAKANSSPLTISSAKWKKVQMISSGSSGVVYWRVVGYRADKTKDTSEIRSITTYPCKMIDGPTLFPTGKNTLPELSWQNACNVKFKVWFGSDALFSKKYSLNVTLKNPTRNGGVFTRTLTSSQWAAIRKLVGDASGSTIYWYVESWDRLKRYSRTDTLEFLLID